jgi:hypothetical protein
VHRRGHEDSLLDEKRMPQWSISHCADCGRAQQLSPEWTFCCAPSHRFGGRNQFAATWLPVSTGARNGVSLCHPRPEAYHGVILGR